MTDPSPTVDPTVPSIPAFTHVVSPGCVRVGSRFARLFCKIDWDGHRLSITGVEGPTPNGNCIGACGQIVGHPWEFSSYSPGWDAPTVERFRSVWDEWHLNDMRSGCTHQRANPDFAPRPIEVVTYHLTREARSQRDAAREACTTAFLEGDTLSLTLTPTDRALLAIKNEWKETYSPPDADSPLSGCYEVSKRETKSSIWVYPHEHPLGVLTRPCPTCGYRYGSAWLYEPIPPSILDWLRSLPPSPTKPNWV